MCGRKDRERERERKRKTKMGNNNSTAQNNNRGGGNHSPTNNNNDNDDASSLGAHSSFSQGGASSSHHSTYEHGPVTQMVPIPGAQSSHLNSLGGGGGRGQQGGGEALEPALVPVAITCEWRSFLRFFSFLVRFSRRVSFLSQSLVLQRFLP